MKRNGLREALGAVLVASLFSGSLVQAQDEMRVWKNQEGREIKAVLVAVNGPELTLRVDNGMVHKVPLSSLSPSDQAFAKSAGVSPTKPASSPPGSTRPALGALEWPTSVTVNPKELDIKVGWQDAAKREFQYKSGSFLYIAKAPLAASVMKDVALDFELAQQLVRQLPWGWAPRPKDGSNFKVYLTETLDDFVALGGNDTSGGGSKDDYVFLKFSELGLKQVGPRYAFDARARSEGEVMGMTMQLLTGEMRNLLEPWSAFGFEEFIRKVAYHNGTVRFAHLDATLKQKVAAETRTKPDVKRMIACLHMPYKDLRTDVKQIRVENRFDAMMLVYFFGFLDGDGKGTRLLQYYRSIAQESLDWRDFRDSNGTSPRPRPAREGSFPEWSADHMKVIIAGRTDAQLQAEMTAKFKAIGVKVD